MTSWLNKQRKQTLLDLSAEAGLKQYAARNICFFRRKTANTW
jgi:hypothetical protein